MELSFLFPVDLFDLTGSDNAGRPLIIVVGSALPAKSLSPERLLFYVIRVMDQPVESDYALIYIHTGASSENRFFFFSLSILDLLFFFFFDKLDLHLLFFEELIEH